MRVSEVSQLLGVDAETIRYYEREKLLPAPGRESNGYRTYSKMHLERIAFIRHCRALGMSLHDVRWLMDFIAAPQGDCSAVNDMIAHQLDVVTARLRSLRGLKKQLEALQKQCAVPSARRACGIVEELVSAAKGEACVCHEGGDVAAASKHREK